MMMGENILALKCQIKSLSAEFASVATHSSSKVALLIFPYGFDKCDQYYDHTVLALTPTGGIVACGFL